MARVTVAAPPAAASDFAAERLAGAIEAGRSGGHAVHLALAGGDTPRPAYERLAELIDDWEDVELWLGDERLVPADDPASNYRMLSETLLERTTGASAHPVPTEGNSAEQAATAYAELIAARVPAGTSGLPSFDAVLLGLGEDGHTASLFPNAPALRAGGICVAVHDAPKPPPDRVTMTLGVLSAARTPLMLATGAGKAGAVAAVVGDPDPAVPASLLGAGPLELILDPEAASALGE
ncbi:MAG: 6-phosphogluconolactonase [Solirubrobacterales bacterium]